MAGVEAGGLHDGCHKVSLFTASGTTLSRTVLVASKTNVPMPHVFVIHLQNVNYFLFIYCYAIDYTFNTGEIMIGC